MPVDWDWEWLRFAEHDAYLNSSLLPEGSVFEPGDIAFAYGNIYACFYQYLQDQGYQLKNYEDYIRSHQVQRGRYCVVIGQTDNGRYLVYFLTTFGGSQGYGAEIGPVARYFGVPIGDTHWPSLSGIKILPRWRDQSFAFCVPALRDNLQLSNLNTHLRLAPGELDRLNGLCDARLARLDKFQNVLRSKHGAWLRSRRLQAKNAAQDIPASLPSRRSRIRRTRLWDDTVMSLEHRRFIFPPIVNNDGKWLLRYSSEDLNNRSTYLNTLAPKLLKHQTLTAPYFAHSLRNSAAAIARIIH